MHSRLPRLVVQRLRLPHLIATNPHQSLGRRDAADPTPEMAFTAVLLDVAHHLEERLLQHVLGILRPPHHAPDEIVDRRLEGPEQGFEGHFISGLRAGDEDIRDGETRSLSENYDATTA